MNQYQLLYEDTLTKYEEQIKRSRAMNDQARVAWLKEAQTILNREIASFSDVARISTD